MMRVISSPSSSTIGFFTWIFAMGRVLSDVRGSFVPEIGPGKQEYSVWLTRNCGPARICRLCAGQRQRGRAENEAENCSRHAGSTILLRAAVARGGGQGRRRRRGAGQAR